MTKILDLGCGGKKIPNSFAVDFLSYPGVDFKWNLNEELPKKFHNKFDVVHTKRTLDHLGNPLGFLEGCAKYLKKNGKLVILIDNGDYWRHHVYLGNYHANIFEDETDEILTHHKMMFQMKHISKMLSIAGLKVVKEEYYRDYKFPRGHIDYLMPKHLGCNMMRIEAIK